MQVALGLLFKSLNKERIMEFSGRQEINGAHLLKQGVEKVGGNCSSVWRQNIECAEKSLHPHNLKTSKIE